MAKDTLTFEVGGRVAIADFDKGMAALHRLVAALTPHKADIVWVVEDLQPGSATVTLRSEADNPALVESIVADYGKIGDALARHEELSQFPSRVRSAANAVLNLTETTDYVRFETPDGDATIYPNGHVPTPPRPRESIGAITGRVQTVSNRGRLRFNLYDTIFDKAVACYLAPGQEELVREAWGRRARVSGRISREANTGRPLAIRNIMNVQILEDAPPGSYRLARGAVPRPPGSPLAEEAIRRLRDA